ncbi:MAG: hypothetical protein WKF71_17795 [Pyrinomonadaceae bacterium]
MSGKKETAWLLSEHIYLMRRGVWVLRSKPNAEGLANVIRAK